MDDIMSPFLLSLETYVKYVRMPMHIDLHYVRSTNRMRKYVVRHVLRIVFISDRHILLYHGFPEYLIETMSNCKVAGKVVTGYGVVCMEVVEKVKRCTACKGKESRR
jgi:hypothetical protein